VVDLITGKTGIIVSIWKCERGIGLYIYQAKVLTSGAYAAFKGFGQFDTINPGEGFWVNNH
jgi:hypothetical protein